MELTEILKAKNMTKAAFAEKMGIAPQNVNVLFKNPTEQRIKDAATALGVPIWHLFVSPEEVAAPTDNGSDFAAFVRCGGKHYTADTLDEFNKIVEEIKGIRK